MKHKDSIDKKAVISFIIVLVFVLVLITVYAYKKAEREKSLNYIKSAYPVLYSEMNDRYSDVIDKMDIEHPGYIKYTINCDCNHFRKYSLTSETYLEELKNENNEMIECIKESHPDLNHHQFVVTYILNIDKRKKIVSFNYSINRSVDNYSLEIVEK